MERPDCQQIKPAENPEVQRINPAENPEVQLVKPAENPDYQQIFSRYELKFFLSGRQRGNLLTLMEGRMKPDKYGRTSIRNIYFDTDDFRLVRHSLERPSYKEKLRLRSYGKAAADSAVFVELKKKYQSVVYKRRLALPENQAMEWLLDDGFHPEPSQIADELEYFLKFYGTLKPKAFLSYDREAYLSQRSDGLRVTFDTNIRCRWTELSLEDEIWGEELLKPGQVLMEIKTPGGIPLWLTHFLTQNRIYKTSFSKYGTAFLRRTTKKPGFLFLENRGADQPFPA